MATIIEMDNVSFSYGSEAEHALDDVSLRVDEGDFVTQGQQIGTTQGHVICEMRVGDIPVNPWDAWRGAGGLFF